MKIVNLTEEYLRYAIYVIKTRWNIDHKKAAKEVLRWFSNTDDSICFIGIIDGLPMGLGVFDVTASIDPSIRAWNRQVYVEPKFNGSEYGFLFTKRRWEYAKGLGHNKVYIDTKIPAYHRRYGWKEIYTTQQDGNTRHIMEYNL